MINKFIQTILPKKKAHPNHNSLRFLISALYQFQAIPTGSKIRQTPQKISQTLDFAKIIFQTILTHRKPIIPKKVPHKRNLFPNHSIHPLQKPQKLFSPLIFSPYPDQDLKKEKEKEEKNKERIEIDAKREGFLESKDRNLSQSDMNCDLITTEELKKKENWKKRRRAEKGGRKKKTCEEAQGFHQLLQKRAIFTAFHVYVSQFSRFSTEFCLSGHLNTGQRERDGSETRKMEGK